MIMFKYSPTATEPINRVVACHFLKNTVLLSNRATQQGNEFLSDNVNLVICLSALRRNIILTVNGMNPGDQFNQQI